MGASECACCGYRTISAGGPGSFEICPVCHWEDDAVQYDDPDFWGGANPLSLREAQQNFLEFGASMREDLKKVRPPRPDEVRDPNWRPLPPEK
jgi:hypothetical protein